MGAVDNCSLPNREYLMEPIHMKLSQKLKIFLDFFLHFENLGSILNILIKKDDAHSLFICEATAYEKGG